MVAQLETSFPPSPKNATINEANSLYKVWFCSSLESHHTSEEERKCGPRITRCVRPLTGLSDVSVMFCQYVGDHIFKQLIKLRHPLEESAL